MTTAPHKNRTAKAPEKMEFSDAFASESTDICTIFFWPETKSKMNNEKNPGCYYPIIWGL